MKINRLRVETIAAVLVAIVSFLASCTSPNEPRNRVFYPTLLRDSLTLDLPLLRFQEFDGKIYAYDFYDKRIVQIDSQFQVIKQLGSFGDGPKENLLVRDYQVLSSGLVAIFDVDKNTFKIQSFEDSVYLYKKFDFDMEGGAYWRDSVLLTMAMEDRLRLNFAYYSIGNSRKEPISALNDLFQEDYSGLIYQGKLLSSKERLVFTSYFSSFWFVLDKESGKVQSGKYLHDYEKPKVLDEGGIVMLEDAPELIYDSFMTSDEILIISNIGHIDYPDQRILDVYDLEFNYLRSYPLPNLNDTTPDEVFSFKESEVVVLYEDKLYFFQIG
ncbi:hypothetical protein [Algoriphagus formosus]|uniref:hypothetical protein n=1 Tax=Algoriphagus formosus TaxID=2007308 RepID=UPI003F6E7EE1